MPQTQVSHSVPTQRTTHVNRAAQQRLPSVGTFLQSPIYLFFLATNLCASAHIFSACRNSVRQHRVPCKVPFNLRNKILTCAINIRGSKGGRYGWKEKALEGGDRIEASAGK